LFIGVAVAPSINSTVVKASTDNDLVEVTSQACGIQGFGNTTVKLTKQQYNDLEQYLVDFRARLNQTISREEAVPLFKDAVVELNKYGLLPKGMSVEQAQRLVTIGEHIENIIKNIKKFNPSTINVFCLFAGKFTNCLDFNIWTGLALLLLLVLNKLDFNPYSPGLGVFLLLLLEMAMEGFSQLKPLRFMNVLEMQSNSQVIFFSSIGALGIKQGQLPISKVIGFTGLKISIDLDTQQFYLGFALDVQGKSYN